MEQMRQQDSRSDEAKKALEAMEANCSMRQQDTYYFCDPTKNINCSKTSCYINGGPCRATTKEEYSMDGEANPLWLLSYCGECKHLNRSKKSGQGFLCKAEAINQKNRNLRYRRPSQPACRLFEGKEIEDDI